ncbi:tRNA-i(6)A37 methylthiotransferase [hydrothermal vent metagenome]|uniref:tRNA-i(6)A37 methylthiotransferase n=1 Tax=hydrothermal vent metagenome TaxID=652676 RepID=A0A3B1DKA1_9ZZZZ
MSKKVLIQTFGCQMNEYDTELIRSILMKVGYVFVEDELSADIVMLNTCAVRENAHRKVYGRIHEIRHNRKKKDGGSVMIGILGCMATNLRTDLLEDKNLKIDFIAGPDSYKRLPDLIRPTSAEFENKPFDVTLSEFETYSDIYPSRKNRVNAWIAVMRGCNNFCTFCVVPYTRGRERSRSPENVVEEAKKLADEGFKQITLLGQNVNSYNYEKYDFAYLMEQVSKVNGIERIRFTSPHPKDFPEKFLELMAHNPKICKQIHLPLQSGNSRVLDMMERTYSQKEFLHLVDKIRKYCPTIALSTDIIIGFPTETDEEFEDTYKVMKEVKFDSAYIFKYSERQNTIAARKFPDDVSEESKTERIVRLNVLQKDISLRKNEAHVGEIHNILIEEIDTEHVRGRTDGNKLVTLPSQNYALGDFVKTKITYGSPYSLKGVPST